MIVALLDLVGKALRVAKQALRNHAGKPERCVQFLLMGNHELQASPRVRTDLDTQLPSIAVISIPQLYLMELRSTPDANVGYRLDEIG